jgi:AraC family transcriptional regulator
MVPCRNAALQRVFSSNGRIADMSNHRPGERKLLTPDERLAIFPFAPRASSEPLAWPELRVEYWQGRPDVEMHFRGLTHHLLVLYLRTPELLLHDAWQHRHAPVTPSGVVLYPAGAPTRWRCRGEVEAIHVLLAPQLLSRVAVETCDLDPQRIALTPVFDLNHAPIQSAILALRAELTSPGAGGRLVAESLGNVLAIHLLRLFTAPGELGPRPRERLPRSKLQAVVRYVEEHLDTELTLDDLAAVAHLSPYHFARLFRNSTGLPPRQYVIARRVERAKELLRDGDGMPLADVAAEVGFANQSHFTRHFKRLVGVTPGHFR